tara:strand:+ start:345 stop:2774 length:2430 start_codon:yes stop_codon:yes gene_type:complete
MALFTGHTITPDSALGGTKIQRGLRFDSNDNNAHLIRTPSSDGNQKIWTFSAWIKTSHADNGPNYIYTANNGNVRYFGLYFRYNELYSYFHPGNNYGTINDRLFRDVNSWFHLVHQVDATNTTQRLWINGSELSLNSGRNPGNSDYPMNESGVGMYLGKGSWRNDTIDGYLAEIHYSDGNKYEASDFGYTDAQTGQWRPKNGNVIKSNITYGTNGYWLDFRDKTSTTTLGYDYSGNGNHFTANNISVSAGTDNDCVEDTPTNNFPTLNPTDSEGNAPSDGSLRGGTAGTSGWRHTRSTVPLPSTGKWYWEYKVPTTATDGSNGWMTGIAYSNLGFTQDINSDSTGLYGRQTRGKYNNSSSDPVTDNHFSTPSDNDIFQFAYDADSQTLFTGRNNTWELSANPSTGANPNWTGVASGGFPMAGSYGSNRYVIINFGQQEFSYTPPTGYASLSGHNRATANAAGVVNPQRHFETILYTGNNTSAARTIDDLEFAPDLVWQKRRNGTNWQTWHDTVRGATKTLYSNSNSQEATNNQYGYISSFNKDGFTWSPGSTNNSDGNESSGTFVSWCWRAGGAAVSNSDGSITTSISANQEAGFSIVTYTGTGSAATIGHGLGKAPKVVLTKLRDTTTQDWFFMPGEITSDRGKYIKFNAQDAIASDTNVYPNTATTSTVYSIGTDNAVNGSGSKYVSYCWSEIPGYSKFGTYTGNGSSDGPFVHLGFKPAWFLVRGTHGDIWYVYDNKRNTFNVVDKELNPNRDQTEATFTTVDFLSNGFKIRTSNSSFNYNNYTYMYMTFAERPSKTIFGLDANAR